MRGRITRSAKAKAGNPRRQYCGGRPPKKWQNHGSRQCFARCFRGFARNSRYSGAKVLITSEPGSIPLTRFQDVIFSFRVSHFDSPLTVEMNRILTYMSIASSIVALTTSGKLCKYPLRSRQPAKRRLFLTETALKDLEDPNSATNISGVRGFIESAMTRWVLGQRVFADEKGKPRFLKRLDPPPPEIWEIRVIEPRVQARLFGRFAEPDTLILNRFHSRGVLRDKKKSAAHDSEWQVAMKECEATWNKLFPGIAPFSGPNIRAYVTENCDDFTI